MFDLDLSKVKFSKMDKFFNIKIPDKLSTDLAYETGLHIGDGHLTMIKRKDTNVNLFHIVFSGNWLEEKDFYYETISPLIFKIYNKQSHIRMDHKNAIRLYFNSKAIATFKSNVLGLPIGKKIGKVRIPKIIRDSSLEIRKNCLKGIIDSDFCLSFKKGGRYPDITASFPIECKNLINDIEDVLSDLDVGCCICVENRKDDRYNPIKFYNAYKIDINGKENLNKVVKHISFKNPIHFTKLLLWMKTGRCLPYTTLKDRIMSIASMAQSGRASEMQISANAW